MPHGSADAASQWLIMPAKSTTGAMAELSEVTSRSLTVNVDGTSTASFTINGRHELAPYLEELVVDLRIVRDGDAIFHGRLGASSDEVEPDTHSATFTAVDYTALIDRQEVRSPALTYTGVAQGSIVRQLLDYAFARAGAGLGLTYNSTTVPNTAVTRTVTYDPGKWIGEAIDELAEAENGFDWWVDPTTQTVRLASPARGVGKDLVCEYGSTVSKVSRAFDPSRYGNAIYVTGGEGLVPRSADSPTLSTRPEGRLALVESFPDITDLSLLQAKANQTLTERSAVTPTYSCVMMPGLWSHRDLWVGDTTYLIVKSGRLNIAEQQRVAEIGISTDEENIETVTVTFGGPPPRSLAIARLRSYARRFARVERLGAV